MSSRHAMIKEDKERELSARVPAQHGSTGCICGSAGCSCGEGGDTRKKTGFR